MRLARFTVQARSELLAETSYYEARRKGLGAQFRAEVEAVAERAATFPNSGASSAGGTRRRLLAKFPFMLVYTETDYGVLVHAVAHRRRLPEYWVPRVGGKG